MTVVDFEVGGKRNASCGKGYIIVVEGIRMDLYVGMYEGEKERELPTTGIEDVKG